MFSDFCKSISCLYHARAFWYIIILMRLKVGQKVTDGLLTGWVVTPRCSVDDEPRAIVKLEKTGLLIDLCRHSLQVVEVEPEEEMPPAASYRWDGMELVIVES